MLFATPLRFSALVLVAWTVTATGAQEDASTTSTNEKQPADTTTEEPPPDWGTYYDPRNVFCGEYDCYKILGFDYEKFGSPSKDDIKQSYRSLSRRYHPDKNKNNKEANERFSKIVRANEVLTNDRTRNEYDKMRYNQELYFETYGSSVLWQYAPQTDVTFIICLLLALGSAFTWYAQKAKWQTVADRLTQAAVEDWGHRDGGTAESKELRQKAIDKLAEQEQQEEQSATSNGNGNGTTPPSPAKSGTPKKSGNNSNNSSTKGSGKKGKLTAKEKRKQLEDSIRPIIVEMVDEMEDFGAGFHKPTWRDLLVVKLFKLPMAIASGVAWNTKYFIRRMRKLELSEEEREVLTRRAVGEVTWAAVSNEDRKEMVTLDLWKSQNLVDWREAQDVKTWSSGDQKRYARMKKKGIKMHDD